MEIRVQYNPATIARYVSSGDSRNPEMVLIPAQAAYWIARAYDEAGNYLATAEGKSEAAAREAVEAIVASMTEEDYE